MWLDPWIWKIPGEGNGNPFQYSCLGNPMDRGTWSAIGHGVTKSHKQLKRLSMHTKDQNIIKYKTIKENSKNIYFLTFWSKAFFLHSMLSNPERKQLTKKEKLIVEDIRKNSDKKLETKGKNKDIYNITCTGISEGRED